MIHETISLEKKTPSATLTTYILQNYPNFSVNRTRPLVLVIPGGAYSHYGEREQEAIAIKMNSLGFHSCVLHYTLAPMRFPNALVDAANAVALIRENAKKWGVDSNKIILCGFSAGGHLAASLGCFWNSDFLKSYISHDSQKIQPNFLCLCYPVVTANEKFCHEGSIENVIGRISKEEAEKICLLSQKNKYTRSRLYRKKCITRFPADFHLAHAQRRSRFCQKYAFARRCALRSKNRVRVSSF